VFKAAAKYQRRHLIELGHVLKAGKSVQVYIATPKPRTMRGLLINTAIGLEDWMIGHFKPAWNAMRTDQRRRAERRAA
jgi:hypothetical protein